MGLAAEVPELVGLAADGLGVAAQASGCGDLLAPVEAEIERALADQFLGRVAAAVAGDVARADGDEVRRDAGRVQRVGDARRAEQVDLDGGVERRVEGDRRRRVDDDVAAGEGGPIGVAEAEAVGADVAGDGHARGGRPSPRTARRCRRARLRRRSNASFLKISRRTRSVASWRLLGRTSSTSSHSGTARSSRSTSAVPTNPVLPVMAMRLLARFWRIIQADLSSTIRLPFGREA